MAFATTFSRHKNPNHQKVLSINTAVQGTQGNEPENEIDVTAYAVPGIYEIRCIPKNRVYIGESENLLVRLGKHAASLAQKQHDCTDLQQDWNQIGLKGSLISYSLTWSFLGRRRETAYRRSAYLKGEGEAEGVLFCIQYRSNYNVYSQLSSVN
ncbi:hypothetical protein COCOBI_pt-0430 (chloroplast) [Coccomyxa sp. Obi]|nr:hypothetical protein COCOBI_pt-0430 [Coccomyxa sp. Obi]